MFKVKTPGKTFISDVNKIQQVVAETMDEISNIVGSSLGPGGRNVLIESDLQGIEHKNTKDGVSIYRSLGSENSLKHLIIEQTRSAAVKTVNEAGDGTTTATIISASLIKNLFNFCNANRKYSPQKVVRKINKLLDDELVPFINKNSIKITEKNINLLEKVATISANGDVDMAKAVISAFDEVGYGSSSHVTIQELSGPSNKYEVQLIEGFPISMGYEDSMGKFHTAFINDQAHQRCVLEKPLFLLFDGKITDFNQISNIIDYVSGEYMTGNTDFCNLVLVAHHFSDQIITGLAYNFAKSDSINVIPLKTPLSQLPNAQLRFLHDISAFTGATIFDYSNPMSNFTDASSQLGQGVEKIEMYRFRATVVGNPDPINIETRADEIKKQIEQSNSKIEKILLEEELGKITSGIAQLKVYGGSVGELKEKADRAEDAVCAVRAALTSGCLPGGGRVLLNLSEFLASKFSKDEVVLNVVIPSLLTPFYKLLNNAGYNDDEVNDIVDKLVSDKKIVYNIESQEFGTPEEMGLFDATPAVVQALINAVSIASVMGTLGGIVCFKRDNEFETKAALEDIHFKKTLENAEFIKNEANERP